MSEAIAECLNPIGLTVAMAGAWVTAAAVIVSRADAAEMGVSRWVGSDEDNQDLPLVKNLLAASRSARIALLAVAFGTLFQAVPITVKLIGAVY